MNTPSYSHYRRDVVQMKRHFKEALRQKMHKHPDMAGIAAVTAIGEVFAEAGIVFIGKQGTLMMLDEIAQLVMALKEDEARKNLLHHVGSA